MHVAKVSKKYVTQSGPRESLSYLLRRTYRDGGKVKHETLANFSALPTDTLEAVRASLTGQTLVAAGRRSGGEPFAPARASGSGSGKALGPPGFVGPGWADAGRDVRVDHHPGHQARLEAGHTSWWADTTLAEDLGVAGASIDEVYAAMD